MDKVTKHRNQSLHVTGQMATFGNAICPGESFIGLSTPKEFIRNKCKLEFTKLYRKEEESRI